MGKLRNSLLEGTSGKVGRLVVANVDGVDILKRRPNFKKGPSTKQLLVKERMRMACVFIQPYTKYACQYFGNRRKLRSRYNFALQNVLNAFELDLQNMTITPNLENIKFSEGKLPSIYALSLTSESPGKFKITWLDNTDADPEFASDLLQILIVENQSLKSDILQNQATRSELSKEINLAIQYWNKPLHVYAAFKAADEQMASNSVYLGTITVES